FPCTFDQTAGSCADDCPPGFECSETSPQTCECVQLPPCGLDAGICGGACPVPTDACLFFGTSCVCVPPETACAGDGTTCGGLCPGANDQCLSTSGGDACECVTIQ